MWKRDILEVDLSPFLLYTVCFLVCPIDGLPDNVTTTMHVDLAGKRQCIVRILNGQIGSNTDKNLLCGAM